MKINFEWAEFYKEFAMRILPYETGRKEMLKQLISGFESMGVELPDMDKFKNIDDVDPFTIIGLCNRSMEDGDRSKIAKTLQQIFYIDAFLPTSYEGIPTLDGFFYDGDNTIEDINNEKKEDIKKEGPVDKLWELFHYSLLLDLFQSDDARINFQKYYDLCLEIEGMDDEKLNKGIFWILPNLA